MLFSPKFSCNTCDKVLRRRNIYHENCTHESVLSMPKAKTQIGTDNWTKEEKTTEMQWFCFHLQRSSKSQYFIC